MLPLNAPPRNLGGIVLGAGYFCGLDREAFLFKAEDFHGHVSPGVVLGGHLLAEAMALLGETPYLNVAVETVVCLPDAAQILTPCTLGNGFLQVLDWGKFALTVYDRETLRGWRAWPDIAAIAALPEIAGWFIRGGNGQALPKEAVVGHILVHGPGLVRTRRVRLPRPLKPQDKVATAPCPGCGESYPVRLGPRCPACSGQAYYQPAES